MPEVFKFRDHSNLHDPVGNAFILAMCSMSPEDKSSFLATQDRDKGCLIHLTIDGREASFLAIVERYRQTYRDAVNAEARRLIEEQAQETLNGVSELRDVIQDALRQAEQKARQLFPDEDRE